MSKSKSTYTPAHTDLLYDAKYEYYLVFDNDTGNNEDCRVYYSDLVFARSEKEAIEILALKHATDTAEFENNINRYKARRMDLIMGKPEDAFIINNSNGKRKHFLDIYE